jgi:hypothetical protein
MHDILLFTTILHKHRPIHTQFVHHGYLGTTYLLPLLINSFYALTTPYVFVCTVNLSTNYNMKKRIKFPEMTAHMVAAICK